MTSELPVHRVRAHNSALQSENKIHDDAIAAKYGFRGGLVPGVNVYGYLTTPAVREFGPAWLERGWAEVRFLQPFYAGEEVIARAERDEHGRIVVRGEGEDGVLRATGVFAAAHETAFPDLPAHPLSEARREPGAATLAPGLVLGTLRKRPADVNPDQLGAVDDPLPCYRDLAHPAILLGLANEIFVRNYALGPWIHVSSEVANFGAARQDEEIEIRGQVEARFEKKGHQLVTLALSFAGEGGRPLQLARHTAIYRLRG